MKKKFPKVICDGSMEPMGVLDYLFPVALVLGIFGCYFLMRFIMRVRHFKEKNRWYNKE